MHKVTLRFYVNSLTEHAGGQHTAVLQPSYKDGANAEWAQFTPSGRIELNLSREAAVDFYREAMRNKSTVHIEMTIVDE